MRGRFTMDRYRVVLCMLAGVVGLFGIYGIATAQDSDSASKTDSGNSAIAQNTMAVADSRGENTDDYSLADNDWEFTIVPYFWMSNINGDVTVRGRSTEIDPSFSDLFEFLDFGGQVHTEVRKGRFGIFVDPTYLQLSVDEDVQALGVGEGADVDIVFKEFLLEFGGFYRLGTWPIGSPYNSFVQKAKPSVTLDVLAGGRYIHLDVEIDIDSALPLIPSEVDGDKDWIDPFVGARIILNPTEKLSFLVRSDIGGFDLSFSSDIAWNLVAWIGYELPWYRITPLIGYRVLYTDYDDGSGDDRFAYKTWTYGPIIGIGLRF